MALKEEWLESETGKLGALGSESRSGICVKEGDLPGAPWTVQMAGSQQVVIAWDHPDDVSMCGPADRGMLEHTMLRSSQATAARSTAGVSDSLDSKELDSWWMVSHVTLIVIIYLDNLNIVFNEVQS